MLSVKRFVRRLGVRSQDWGDWQGLADTENQARYETLEALRMTHAPQANVLDLGCGAGILCEYLTTSVSYSGVDLQAAAITEAEITHNSRPHTDFYCTSINHTEQFGKKRFGLIVFNEVLYYQANATEAIQLMNRYESLLAPNGLLLVSIYIDTHKLTRLNGNVWLHVQATYGDRCVDYRYVRNDAHRGWHIAVYQPTSITESSLLQIGFGSHNVDRARR